MQRGLLFQVEGFEQWMDQFFSQILTLAFIIQKGFALIYLKRNKSIFLEADVPPNACQSDIMIEKDREWTAYSHPNKKTGPALMRDIQLPVNIMYKRMNASF
ncbi:hypothetical protein GCM10020331_049930 [Ectobacillus funiculus]